MRENYKAWNLNIDDFYKIQDEQEKLKFLLKFAILAPSSHNSQPWAFSLKEHIVEIHLDETRAPKSDGDDRQVFISIGCAVENLIIAAEYYGYTPKVEFTLKKPVVKIILQKTREEKVNKSNLIYSVPIRATNRNNYENSPFINDFADSLKEFEREDLRVFLVTEKTVKDRVADVALVASIEAMEDKVFRHELYGYVKSNNTKSPMGMPLFGMGISTPISFIAPTMIKHLNMNRINHKKNERILKEKTPIIVILATKENNKEAWIKVGRTYENVALKAQQIRLDTAVWAAPVQVKEFYRDLQKILDTDFRPQVFFRLGQAQKITPHSPRLNVDEVVV